MKIAVLLSDYNAVGSYRLIIPFEHLKLNYPDLKIDLLDNSIIEKRDSLIDYDIIITQRVFHKHEYEALLYYKSKKKIIIQDVDDNLFILPKNNPCYHLFKPGSDAIKYHRKSFSVCDYIFVTHKYLAESLSKHTGKEIKSFYFFPNAVNPEDKKYQLNYRDKLPKDKIIIGYQGGSSHQDDIKLIIEPVKEILKKYDNVNFAYCSNPEYLLKCNIPLNRLHLIPAEKNFDDFKPIPSYFDIGLVPLQDTEFNKCKSYLKIAEYGIYGIPVIASNVGDYFTYVKEYATYHQYDQFSGCNLVDNSKKDWIRAIESTITCYCNKEYDFTAKWNKGQIEYNIVEGKPSLKQINQKRYEVLNQIMVNHK